MKIFCVLVMLALMAIVESRIRNQVRRRRVPSGFSLARLQKDYEDGEEEEEASAFTGRKSADSTRKRDEVVSDAKCLERCNNRLNIGMDMVNAHMAFGSIDVPSVVGPRDLDLFCLLDKQHSQCIDECGYSVQFNLREYVCRHRFSEMLDHQPCYARAAPVLVRHCRPRCGTYSPLEHSLTGYASRCRQLLCDHTCITFVLNKVCGRREGGLAANFLLDFTRLQVEYWIRDFAKAKNVSPTSAYPSSCARLQCDGFNSQNCENRSFG